MRPSFVPARPLTVARLLVGLSCALALVACPPPSPPRGLEQTCANACEYGAAQCDASRCARGCNLVLDRLAENEGAHVLACVASSAGCDDRTWARCAARIGPHADGGPPAPAPPSSDVDDER